MRAEVRLLLGALLALVAGALLAPGYARLMAPYYGHLARALAAGSRWEVVALDNRAAAHGPGSVLHLSALAHAPAGAVGSATIDVDLQAGGALQVPLVFFTLLLCWPVRAGGAVRRRRLVLALPVFVILDAATNLAALLQYLPRTLTVLAGGVDAITGWERWGRFLEAGGRIAVATAAALIVIAAADAWAQVRADRRAVSAG